MMVHAERRAHRLTGAERAQWPRAELLRQSLRRSAPKFAISLLRAYRRRRGKGPRLGDWLPRSTLELTVTPTERSCTSAINFHAHLGRWLSPDGTWMEKDVPRLVAMMDAANIEATVNLDGRWGKELEENLDRYDRAYPGRFFSFCHVDWRLLDHPDGPGLLVKSLEESVARGARGLKVWKDLGLKVRSKGQLVLPGDPRLSPLWEAAGALGIPVLVHVADPVAFFLPRDCHNERIEELSRRPQTAARHGGGTEGFRRLLASFEQVVAAHPGTTFVAAHGLYPENLGYVGEMLERYPNLNIDIAWAHLQLGRQPRAARDLFCAHPGRILFGTDVFPLRQQIFSIYFRFLETFDESFSYTDEEPPGSGRWPIYGLGLPQEVLAKTYKDNALRVLNLGRG
jgi:predicted TIM-barrel fold metal-dependent hydrolase